MLKNLKSNHEQLSFWKGHEWYPVFRRIAFKLWFIVPFYTIEQIKSKYSTPRFYFRWNVHYRLQGKLYWWLCDRANIMVEEELLKCDPKYGTG